jgi:hypothetical protein
VGKVAHRQENFIKDFARAQASVRFVSAYRLSRFDLRLLKVNGCDHCAKCGSVGVVTQIMVEIVDVTMLAFYVCPACSEFFKTARIQV